MHHRGAASEGGQGGMAGSHFEAKSMLKATKAPRARVETVSFVALTPSQDLFVQADDFKEPPKADTAR